MFVFAVYFTLLFSGTLHVYGTTTEPTTSVTKDTSLREQVEQGIATKDIVCSNGYHVLVVRHNGNYACVSEKMAETLDWKVIKTEFKEKQEGMISENNSEKQKEISIEKEALPEINTDYPKVGSLGTLVNLKQLLDHNNTSLPDMPYTDVLEYLTPSYMTEGFEIEHVFEKNETSDSTIYHLIVLPVDETISADDSMETLYQKKGTVISVIPTTIHNVREVFKIIQSNTDDDYAATVWQEDAKIYYTNNNAVGTNPAQVVLYDDKTLLTMISFSHLFSTSEALKIIQSMGPQSHSDESYSSEIIFSRDIGMTLLEKGKILEFNRLKINSEVSSHNFQYSDFTNMDLTGADMSSLDLQHSIFSNTTLRHVIFDDSDLSGIDLGNTDLQNVGLNRVNMTDTNFDGADLRYVNLTGSILDRTDLSNADLSDARLYGMDLSNAIFRNVNFTGADLTGVYLNGADLTGSDLRDVDLSTRDRRGYLEGPLNFSDSNLGKANLSDVDLRGSLLMGVSLSHANLSNANLIGADLSKAKLTNANLSGAQFGGYMNGEYREVKNLPITKEEAIERGAVYGEK